MARGTAFSRAANKSALRAEQLRGAPALTIASDRTSPAARQRGGKDGDGHSVKVAVPVVHWGRVRLDQIDVPKDRLRKVDAAWADVVGKSMRDDGQQQPVRLILEAGGRYTLKIGAHRVAGAKLAGLDELDAGWVHRDWVDRQSSRIPEIVENLIRNELDALSRAHHLAEYKDIHEALHPETKKGGDRGNQHTGGKKSQSEIFSFSQQAAEKTGLSRRAIEIAVSIWHGLSDASRNRLADTALARNQAALRAIAVLEEKLQGRVIDLLLGDDPPASIADAVLIALGKKPPSIADKLFRSVTGGFTRLNAKSRAVIFETYEEEILAHFRKKGIVR